MLAPRRLLLARVARLRCAGTTKRFVSDSGGGSLAEFVANVQVSRIRNFVIIAHIDAGKSTLSDALLVAAGNLTAEDTRQGQVLDKLKVERERGITVKAQMASMRWKGHLLSTSLRARARW